MLDTKEMIALANSQPTVKQFDTVHDVDLWRYQKTNWIEQFGSMVIMSRWQAFVHLFGKRKASKMMRTLETGSWFRGEK